MGTMFPFFHSEGNIPVKPANRRLAKNSERLLKNVHHENVYNGYFTEY